jgi:putative transposase
MGLEAPYPKRRTGIPNQAHRVFPYPLRDLVIDRPNHVWAADITYIPMRRGFLYLVAIVDWASRRVLVWRPSTMMEPDFCIEALHEAIARFRGTGNLQHRSRNSVHE